MNDCWHQLSQFLTWGSSPEGVVFMVGLGALAVWSLGVIRTGIEIIRAASAAWAEGAAKARERRLEKQVISSDARSTGPH